MMFSKCIGITLSTIIRPSTKVVILFKMFTEPTAVVPLLEAIPYTLGMCPVNDTEALDIQVQGKYLHSNSKSVHF